MERHVRSLWNSYTDACKHDNDLQSYDSALKSKFNNALEDGGPGGALRTCEQSIKVLTFSSEKALDEIRSLKSHLQAKKGKWSLRTTSKYEAMVNILADGYVNNTEDLLEFGAELERFLKKARNNCTYCKHETNRYFQMKKDRESASYYTLDQCAGGSSYYRRVEKMLKNLQASDVTCESSTETLLRRLQSVYEKQKRMITSLTEQQGKLGKKKDFISWWRRAKNCIFIGTVACMFVAAIVTTVMGAPTIAATILTSLPSIVRGEHWIRSYVAKYRDSVNYEVDLNTSKLQGARDAKNELGKIKLLIERVDSEIGALLLNPSSTKDEGQIDSSMKLIDSKLDIILEQIDKLEEETKKFSDDIVKARDDVHIRQIRLVNALA